MSDLGDLIAVGLLAEPNGLGLTANEAHAIGNRIAPHLPLASQEWRDHVPSGYVGPGGTGQVSCSCGWLSDDGKLDWEAHIDAAERMGRATG